MVIQTELQGDMEPAAPFDQPPAEPIANNEEVSRNVLVPVDPPAEGNDHLLPITLEVDTPKSSSSDLLDALPSPQQPQTSMSLLYDDAMSPFKCSAFSFDGGVCTPKTVPASTSTTFSQNSPPPLNQPRSLLKNPLEQSLKSIQYISTTTSTSLPIHHTMFLREHLTFLLTYNSPFITFIRK